MATLTVWSGADRHSIEFQPPQPLDLLLNQKGFLADHPCGGRGTCGKCAVRIHGNISAPSPAEMNKEYRLRCQTELLGDAEVWISEHHIETHIKRFQTKSKSQSVSIGAAVDIGTTTLAAKIYDLHTGSCLAECVAENPQRSVAADVMGRINAALSGSGQLLQQQVLAGMERILVESCAHAGCGLQDIERMTIVGNTTMLYLLLDKSPKALSSAPFHAEDLFGRDEVVFNRRVWIPQCMSAFVGADITAAILASGMCRSPRTALLCDIGTNGELALWKSGTLYVTSTAAGPALEGAQISCGCSNVSGAIDKVWQDNGAIKFHTIGDLMPVGICGSGLIDAIATLLETEALDETGAMENDHVQICDSVSISQKDIRNVQLAKAAIAAGIETLMDVAGVGTDDIAHLYVAGNFGSHLDMHSAARIGLFPQELQDRTKILGNAALDGAAMILQDDELKAEVKNIVGCAVTVNLGGNPLFNEKFIEHMLFEAY